MNRKTTAVDPTSAGRVESLKLLASLTTMLDRSWSEVALAGAGNWTGSFSTPGGVHESFELSVVLEGHGAVVVNGRDIEVDAGDVLVCDMYLPHRHVLPGLTLRYINFRIRDEAMRGRVRRLIGRLPTPLVQLPGAESAIGQFLEDLGRLEREYRWNRPLGPLMAKSAFLSLLVRLVRFVDDPGGHGSLASRVSSFLEARLEEPIRLADVAARFSLTPRHLNVVFKRHTGTTIAKHLTDLRIDRSRRLLTHTDRTVTDIALETGFCDCQHFCNVFKTKTGCTPTEYRRG